MIFTYFIKLLLSHLGLISLIRIQSEHNEQLSILFESGHTSRLYISRYTYIGIINFRCKIKFSSSIFQITADIVVMSQNRMYSVTGSMYWNVPNSVNLYMYIYAHIIGQEFQVVQLRWSLVYSTVVISKNENSGTILCFYPIYINRIWQNYAISYDRFTTLLSKVV